jgi:hypothetical protein
VDSTCTLRLLRECGWGRFRSTPGKVCLRLRLRTFGPPFPSHSRKVRTKERDHEQFRALHHKITYIEFTTTRHRADQRVLFDRLWLELQGLGSGLHRLQCGRFRGSLSALPRARPQPEQAKSAPLIVLYSADLESYRGRNRGGRRQHCRTHLRVSRWTALPLLRRRGKCARRLVGVIPIARPQWFRKSRLPHPFAFFAKGWERASLNQFCLCCRRFELRQPFGQKRFQLDQRGGEAFDAFLQFVVGHVIGSVHAIECRLIHVDSFYL